MVNLDKNSQIFHNSIVLKTNNIKLFHLSLQFSNYFKDLLYNKNILVTQINININSNRLDLALNLYFRKKKLIKFKKIKRQKDSQTSKTSILFVLLKDFKLFFRNNTLNIKIKVLNKVILFPFLFRVLKKNLKSFKRSLFERRTNLYLDFLKITVLYQTSQVSLDSFLFILAEIFQRLTKKRHSNFIKFIKFVFKNFLLKYKNKNLYNMVKGIKFVISGKLKGKLRAQTTSLSFGHIPISTNAKNIQFSKSHVYTVYGTYGIKLWVYQQVTSKKTFDKSLSTIEKKKNKYKKNFTNRK